MLIMKQFPTSKRKYKLLLQSPRSTHPQPLSFVSDNEVLYIVNQLPTNYKKKLSMFSIRILKIRELMLIINDYYKNVLLQ